MLITYIAVFILGSLWGSFSNVCIYRLPEGGNIVSTRSACRSCQSKISWFDNIPFISFVILKGKCRNCDFKIPYQYFDLDTDSYKDVFGFQYDLPRDYTSHSFTWEDHMDRHAELEEIAKEYISLRNITTMKL